MKTLCHAVTFIRKGYWYNDGFCIVEIDDNNTVKSIEGILTNDYLKAIISKDNIKFVIYSNWYEEASISINKEDFRLPIQIQANNDFYDVVLELNIGERLDLKKYKERLDELKNVFKKERE